jgi:hypothetical protein
MAFLSMVFYDQSYGKLSIAFAYSSSWDRIISWIGYLQAFRCILTILREADIPSFFSIFPFTGMGLSESAMKPEGCHASILAARPASFGSLVPAGRCGGKGGEDQARGYGYRRPWAMGCTFYAL